MFIIKTSFGIIIKVTGLVILFIDDKYFSNKDAKTRVCIIKYFIAIFIEVSSEKDKWQITKDRGVCGELTAVVTFIKRHLYCKNKWLYAHKGLCFEKWIWIKNELQKFYHKFGMKILIKKPQKLKWIPNQTWWYIYVTINDIIMSTYYSKLYKYQ